ISLVEPAVDPAGNLRGVGSADNAGASVEQNHNHDFWVSLVGVGNKPAEASAYAFIVTRARLPEVLFAIRVVAALGRPVENGSEHSLSKVRKQRSDIEPLANPRLEVLARSFGARILQIILRAAIGQHSNQRCKLKRRDADAFAEARHARHPSKKRRRRRQRSRLLFGNAVTDTLPQPQQRVIFQLAIKTEPPSDFLEKLVIGMRHRLRQIDIAARFHPY